ncbi:hypothetical protein IJ182_06525 [bacterium]|nr:hypothetical protein [bacterium]
MKKILLLFTILSVSVITTACINNFAIQELNNKAESYMNKGDVETAICRLKSSLDLDNDVYQTHYNLAVAYNNTGNYEGVINESKKVLELKPDFYDALYIMAIAKEAIAYQIIEQHENPDEMSLDEIADFNNKASDAVDTFNKYLVNKATATETEQINNKIAEINNKIKEYTDIYDRKSMQEEAPAEEEIVNEDNNEESEEVTEEENQEEISE